MIEIALAGQPFWARRLATLINRHSQGSMRAVALIDLRRTPLVLMRAIAKADVLIRVGFRPGATSPRGFAFDLLWASLRIINPKAATVYYWIGTDVVNAIEDFRNDRLNRWFFEHAKRDTHFAGAPWFVDELATIDIKAKDVLFPTADLNIDSISPLPAKFSVMSYIPDARHQYYGSESLVEAAARLPEIEFHIVGGEGGWSPLELQNLHFHGWQAEMKPFYESSTVVIRLVPHDALGGTVREGLAHARQIIYSYPMDFTHLVPYGDTEALISTLRQLRELHETGELRLNEGGREYSMTAFNEARTTQHLIDSINEARLTYDAK